MHDNLDMFKDPVFWRVLVMGVLPVALSGAALVWLEF